MAIATLLAAAFAASPGGAEGFLGKPALGSAALDGLRGGFVGADGVRIAVGIERLVHVNGELASSTMLRISDLGDIRARGIELEGPARGLVQNGPGNFVEPGLLHALAPGMLTLVQNSLNNQVIVGTTRIDISVTGARAMRLSETLSGLNLQLRSALR
jgi:hypothetical protein